MQAEMTFATGSEVLDRVRLTGILPTEDEAANLTAAERDSLPSVWMEGMKRVADAVAIAERKAFAARGWAFQWFSEWNPQDANDRALAAALDCAIDVAEDHMPRITEREFEDPANMGILQSKGYGGAEGIQVKRDPYGHLVLVSVHCVTGPMNFVPGEGVEFEAGAKSHVFHLVYDSFPTVETVVGDLAAYPLVKKVENRQRAGYGGMWHGEGWTGAHSTRPHVHRPWNTLKGDRLAA